MAKLISCCTSIISSARRCFSAAGTSSTKSYALVFSSWLYVKMPTRSNLCNCKNSFNSSTSSKVSPGKPVIRVVLMAIPGTRFLISIINSVISSRVIFRRMALSILLLACCKGMSMYLQILSRSRMVSNISKGNLLGYA